MTRYLEIKSGSISEVAKKLREDYDAYFKKELEKEGKPIASMTDAEKKAFFNRVDKGYNSKDEATSQDISPSMSNKPVAAGKTVLVAAPGGKEKVLRIPVEKLADYKAKGYVEAEEFVPEAAKEPYAIGMAAAMKATGDTPPLKKSTIIKAHDIAKKIEKNEELTAAQKKLPPALQKAIEKKDKNEEVEIKEGGMKEIDTNKKELERLSTRLSQLRDRKNANAGGDTTDVEKQIKQTQMSVIDLKKKLSATKTEEVEITEAEGSSGGGMDALRAIKAKRQRLQGELEALNKDDPNYKEKRAAKQKEIEAQKEIMARKQREVFDSYDPSLKELEELETVEEAAGPDRLTNLNDKITKLQVNISKLDMSKPESKTKEAIMKADLTTAKLRLQDAIQKKNTETKKESVNEAKKNYKNYKKSLKKEEENPKNMKKTLTGQPVTKIDVEPKLANHN